MGKKDPRVDAYIEKSADFAKPILKHLRKVVHAAVPDVEETMKWSCPHFMYKGMLAGMSSFKEHCAFGFWKGSLVFGEGEATRDAMGHFGRITSLKERPSDRTLTAYIRKAARLNDEDVQIARPKRAVKKKDLSIPYEFAAAIAKNGKARETFDNFSYSHKKEYVEWVAEAKTDETRKRRIQTALEWMAEGKSRHWKYVRA
jgi:uncharacterized protein YdeI (YjbR/CyaY-like superfamily)